MLATELHSSAIPRNQHPDLCIVRPPVLSALPVSSVSHVFSVSHLIRLPPIHRRLVQHASASQQCSQITSSSQLPRCIFALQLHTKCVRRRHTACRAWYLLPVRQRALKQFYHAHNEALYHDEPSLTRFRLDVCREEALAPPRSVPVSLRNGLRSDTGNSRIVYTWLHLWTIQGHVYYRRPP